MFGFSRKERYSAAKARFDRALARLHELQKRAGACVLLKSVACRELDRLVPNHPLGVRESMWRDAVADKASETYAVSASRGLSHDDCMAQAGRRAKAETVALLRGGWRLPDLITPVPLASAGLRRFLMGDSADLDIDVGGRRHGYGVAP